MLYLYICVNKDMKDGLRQPVLDTQMWVPWGEGQGHE